MATADETQSTPLRIYKLKASDDQIFQVDENVIEQLSTVKELRQTSNTGDAPIPLIAVSATMLEQVIEFYNHHKNESQAPAIGNDNGTNGNANEQKKFDSTSEWNLNFMKQFTVADGTLFEIITVANYLGAKSLLEVALKTIVGLASKDQQKTHALFDTSCGSPAQASSAPSSKKNSSDTAPSN
ncbi:unnamed protein product [Adineta ricciae]|uniref:SKP1 component POZ domain-containing protein n=1 Tax=Adineta ricciae TaxID=249248 RepID=A0A814GNQ5_ADIRI|nr:unnamed protein product [Adineta ricciae]CAF1160918.1 unnamed protein product [Adineta ricciae]